MATLNVDQTQNPAGLAPRHSSIVKALIDAGKFLLALVFTVVAFGAMNWYLAECWRDKYGNTDAPQHGNPGEVKPALPDGVSMLVPHEATHGVMHRRG